jgi:hypothetical protein
VSILTAPDHITLSRRSQGLDVDSDLGPIKGPIHLLIDSTGLCVASDAEWAAAKYGGRGKRAWKKLHLDVHRSEQIGCRQWKKVSGDPRQAPVENPFFRYKKTLGPELRARPPESQRAEARTACSLLNTLIARGKPEPFAIADSRKGGTQSLRSIYASTPLVAAIEDPWAAQKILACLDLPARAPPLAPPAAKLNDVDPGLLEDFDPSPTDEDP